MSRLIVRQLSYQNKNLRQQFLQNQHPKNGNRRSSTIEMPTLIKENNQHYLKHKYRNTYAPLKNDKDPNRLSKNIPNDQYQGDIYNQFIRLESKKKEQPVIFKIDYNVFDLTQSLIHSGIKKVLLSFIYSMLVIIRYVSIASLIYLMIATDSHVWQWIFSLIVCHLLYTISILKISLRNPTNPTEILLKSCFNSLQQNQFSQYFEVVSYKKLFRTLIRTLIPAQISFFMIVKVTKQRRFDVYCAINYIYSSIQTVLYYPFFITYTTFMYNNLTLDIQKYIYRIILVAAIASELIFILLTIYIICKRCRTGSSYNKANSQQYQ